MSEQKSGKFVSDVILERAASRPLVEEYEKLPAVGATVSCGFCGMGRDKSSDNDMLIMSGFGAAGVKLNGRGIICDQEVESHGTELWLSSVEAAASKLPPQDWRIYFFGPLSEQEYQRQGPDEWVLVSTGQGFA